MHIDTDLHIHTFHSPCGQDEMLPVDIVRTAIKRGLATIAITDHFYPFTDGTMFERIQSDLRKAGMMNDCIEILFGCEVEIMGPGRTAGYPELTEQLDFIMAGATHFQNKGITDLPQGLGTRETAEYVLKVFEYAVGLPWVNVIAHPFFIHPIVCSGEVVNSLTEDDLLPPLKLARDNNVAMEISRRIFHTPEQLTFARRFYPLCKEAGLRFTTGSDAHCLADIGNVHVLEPALTEFGLTEKDFWVPESKVSSRLTV